MAHESWGQLPLLAAHAAQLLGLFEALIKPADAATLARVSGAWLPALARLLPVLVLGGFVERDGEERFRRTDRPPPDGPVPPAAAVIAEVLRRQAPLGEADLPLLRIARQLAIPADLARIQSQAREAATLAAPHVGEGAWSVDLGCGIGLYSAALLAAAPGVRALLVDRAHVIEQAARFLSAFRARLDFVAGDLEAARLPARSYRVAFLCDVLHTLPPDVAARVVARAADALDPGGLLLVVEWAEGGALGTLHALSAQLFGAAGDSYGAEAIRSWCEGAGLVDVRSQPAAASPDVVFYLATRPGATRAPAAPNMY